MNIDHIVHQLGQLHAGSVAVRKRSQRDDEELRSIELTPFEFPDQATIPTRMDCVSDRKSGLDYAAWSIGDTLGAVGGHTLMRRVFDAFSDTYGPRAASWLDHRWSGAGGVGQSAPWIA